MMSLVHELLVAPMLKVMAGHLDAFQNQTDLIPLVQELVATLSAPDESAVREMVLGTRLLSPRFAQAAATQTTLLFPSAVQTIVLNFCNPVDAAKLKRVWHGSSTSYMRMQWEHLTEAERQARVETHVGTLMKLLPMMGQKLQDRQPELCAGGANSRLDQTATARVKNAKMTTDLLEGDFGIMSHLLASCPSMSSETTSTYVKAKRNKMIDWLFGLPMQERHAYVRLARLVATSRGSRASKRRARRKQLVAQRIAKAKEQSAEAAVVAEKKTAQLDTALAAVWRTEQDMNTALHKRGGQPLADSSQRSALSPQFTFMSVLGVWEKPPGFNVNGKKATPLPELVHHMKACIAKLATEVKSLEARASESKAQLEAKKNNSEAESGSDGDEETEDEDEDDSEEEEDDGVEQPYQMPCCGGIWRQGVFSVECERCFEWFHADELGACPGVCTTYQVDRGQVKSKEFHFVCSGCLPRADTSLKK